MRPDELTSDDLGLIFHAVTGNRSRIGIPDLTATSADVVSYSRKTGRTASGPPLRQCEG